MKTIKIIDLFVKIANNEEVPKKISYKNTNYIYNGDTKQYYIEGCMGTYDNSLRYVLNFFNRLNDEVEIIEEEKKLPEKLNYPRIAIESSADDEIRDYLYKVKDKFDEIIDYLESKEKGE